MNLLEQTDGDDLPKLEEGKNYLEELVGPGKKFATVEDMARGKFISDEVIKVKNKRFDMLSDEYKKIRDENIAGPKLQELLDKNEEILKQLTTRQNTQQSNEDSKAAYDPKEVESLVSSVYQKEKQTDKELANFNSVKDKLIERFGTNYKDVVKEQSNSLGLTDEEVNLMARKNPNLFSKTFDLDAAKKDDKFQAPPRSDKRSDNFAPRTAEKRDWAYYTRLKEKDPMAWMDKKTAVQMEKDAQALGKDFYS